MAISPKTTKADNQIIDTLIVSVKDIYPHHLWPETFGLDKLRCLTIISSLNDLTDHLIIPKGCYGVIDGADDKSFEFHVPARYFKIYNNTKREFNQADRPIAPVGSMFHVRNDKSVIFLRDVPRPLVARLLRKR